MHLQPLLDGAISMITPLEIVEKRIAAVRTQQKNERIQSNISMMEYALRQLELVKSQLEEATPSLYPPVGVVSIAQAKTELDGLIEGYSFPLSSEQEERMGKRIDELRHYIHAAEKQA